MNRTPKIAVLISAYNAEATINKTIQSLNANSEPHDIYIVDDGSRIPVVGVVPRQENITVLRTPQNLRLPKNRNFGLRHILQKDYQYVAIMDADDLAQPDRLSTQRQFLDEHGEIGLAGSWVRVISETGKPLYNLNLPTADEDIRVGMFYNNCFIHSTLMVRASMFRDVSMYYEAGFETCEDYYILQKFLKRTKAAIIPAYLVDYTISTNGVTQSKALNQMISRFKVQLLFHNFFRLHSYLGLGKTLAQLALFPYTIRRRTKQIEDKIASEEASPTLVWHPIKGQQRI